MTSVSPTAHNSAMPDRVRPQAITLTVCWRGMRVASHIIYGMLLACTYPLLSNSSKHRILKNWSLKLLGVLHVGLETQGCHYAATAQGRMFVANHISWLDVVALNAVTPACFIAKAEVRDWPLLGWMCQRAQTLFVRRDTKRDTARINRQIAALLEQGECIALFPEGATSASAQPGHFHSSLLQGPIDLKAAIYPVAIRYHDGAGKTCGDAAYVGDMTFIQSLWKILCSPSLHVTLVYLPAIASAEKFRRMLASDAQGAIHAALNNLSSSYCHSPPDSSAAGTCTAWHAPVL